MKRIIVTLFLLLITYISSAQSGWGYVNYTSYKTHAGYGAQNQYAAFPYTKAEFDNMLNTANSNTTITHTGEVPFLWVYNGSTQTPHWGGDYYAIVFEYWFIPQETGTYRFAITSDDASDFSIDGTTLITYYGGHGAGQWIYGQKQLIAGQRYKIIARYQEFGGGDALYVRWARPSNPNYYFYWNNEVTNIGSVPTKQAKMNFDFGSTLDKTKFNIGSALGSTGWVDVTNQLDSNKVANGSKATIIGGGVEWSYVNPNASWLGGNSRLLIDMRKFGNTSPTDVKSVKILDVYEGPVTYTSHDPNGWAIYTVPSPLTKVTDGTSTYNQYIRNVNGWNTDYAFTSNITFGQNRMNKFHKLEFANLTTTQNASLLGSIVTVSDVYLAFREFADRGILGDESKYFSSGIQFDNADVNGDNLFDERDCYLLLTHLQGTTSLWSTTPTISDAIKIISSTNFDNITKQNWNTFTLPVGNDYPFTFTNGILNAYNLDVTWKGDVNLSHSSQPTGYIPSANISDVSQIKSMAVSSNSVGDVEADIMMEKIDDNIVATILLNPNGNQIGATQFDVYFDNSKIEFSKVEFNNTQSTNFGRNNGSFISLGSLSTSGGSISNVGYKVVFKPKTTITNILGLISVKSVETLNTSLNKINVKVL